MREKTKTLAVAIATSALLSAATALAQPVDTARIAGGDPNDWLAYHQSYNGWSYSPLDQINASNVKDLEVAWIHVPGHATRGLQTMPLVADGVLYYTGSYSRVFALDGATGKQLWSYTPELDDALIARQTHSPYNRGAAIGDGRLYVGTVDGRLIALDMKTGKVDWDTKLQDSQKLTVGFTGAPLYAKGTVVIGSQGGEWPGQGPIYGVDAATGKVKWKFKTVGGTRNPRRAMATIPGAPAAAAAGCRAHSSQRQTSCIGAPQTRRLCTTGLATTGKPKARDPATTSTAPRCSASTSIPASCKFYHQELPHDTWDFDSAIGEFVKMDRDGKHYIVHPNKSGFIFVYDRDLKVQNVWPLIHNYNFVKGIDPKTGELIGRRNFTAGKPTEPLCPAIDGGVSWNSGSYSPKTGLYYKIGNEWCIALEVVKTTPVTEPVTQLNIGANFHEVPPPGGEIYGHLDARDPITGEKKWEVRFPQPPLSSVLSTGGNLVFLPDARGIVHAYNAETGSELWNHSDGLGHVGGIISYSAGGKQYIAVTVGFGSLVGDGYAAMFGEPFKSMPRDEGLLVVYSLK